MLHVDLPFGSIVLAVVVVVVDGNNNDEYRIVQFVVEHETDPMLHPPVWLHDRVVWKVLLKSKRYSMPVGLARKTSTTTRRNL